MSSSKSIEAYNNPERAKKYRSGKGFDPPRKARMLEVVVRSLVELVPRGSTVLELGAGSGDLTYRLLGTEHFDIHATDGADAMLELAKNDKRSASMQLSRLDFSDPGWVSSLPRPYDAVTSSMAIHHAESKLGVFINTYEALEASGVFIFSDHMAGSHQFVDGLIERERARVRLGEHIDEEKVQGFIQQDKVSQANEGNHCESVSDYLEALHEAGFKGVDCIWRDYWMAVFVAFKL
ncbi:MAG: class I SAM-dependent methyltransferase [Trueperaceae bacterium]